MPRIRIVGDGERDAAVLPPIIRNVLGHDFEAESRVWARLHDPERKGYERQLRYALQVARMDGMDGLVATVDTDRERPGERLKRLKSARDADRARSPALPAALGEATPHSEAWLDDEVAIREALSLPSGHFVTSVSKCHHPKRELHQLLSACPRSTKRPLAVWADIAAAVRVARCIHRKETGFATFVEDVRAELGPLFAGS